MITSIVTPGAISRGILERVGVRVDVVRTVDHVIPPGVWPDMTSQGYERDDFPRIYRELVEPADIILIAGPIWLGDQSSQTRTIIERPLSRLVTTKMVPNASVRCAQETSWGLKRLPRASHLSSQ